ncbi:myrosinase 1-like [Schistocerca gregaria]|uniref:myrosinase 1-like n=1 Tax=Schistocerca gregaria TaxID=7010 RepID=UPI00211DD2F3|nr:myrosinase 1-like [Schistocerca gregaria]
MWAAVVFAAGLALGYAQTAVNRFPDGFMLGTGSSAYQVEGAWNEDGKGESIWDRMTHENPEYGLGVGNGDVACDSYHKYKEDVQLLKALNADVYRFSISWPRILPTGDLDVINQPGIDYYNNLINELLANGIQPMVTMYHWDLPQALQYIGGWTNPLLADYFVEYARVLFENFGDRVKCWVTFDEPAQFVSGYADSRDYAPSQNAPGIGDYLAAHTVLRAHGRAYRLYDRKYRAEQNGSVGIVLDIQFAEPAVNDSEHRAAADRELQFNAGIFAHPIFTKEGDYPAVVRQRVDANSAAEGRPRSRLPTFTQEEIDYIRDKLVSLHCCSADFFGVNNFRTGYVSPSDIGISPSKAKDTGVIVSTSERSAEGFRKLLNWIAAEYPGYPIIVTANGLPDSGGVNDQNRIYTYTRFLTALLQAVNMDGVPVVGYHAWSLMDNFEWNYRFAIKRGLYEVDFESTNKTRTAKASLAFMSQIYKSRELPLEHFQ